MLEWQKLNTYRPQFNDQLYNFLLQVTWESMLVLQHNAAQLSPFLWVHVVKEGLLSEIMKP